VDILGTSDFSSLKDVVKVNHVAKNLLDGAIVDQESLIIFHLSSLILGWEIGLQKMKDLLLHFICLHHLCYGPVSYE